MNPRWLPIAMWLALLGVSAAIAAGAHYSADLSAFLPRNPSPVQQLLVQQISQGPASRLILIGIDGGDAGARAAASQRLAAALRAQPQFTLVENGETDANHREREFAFTHRYQLSAAVTAARFSVAGLRAAITGSIDLLASPAGLLAKPLFRADPTGETLQVIDQFASTAPPRRLDGVWSSRDGTRALLLAQTRASGADTDAQQRALSLIRTAFARAGADVAATTAAPAVLQLRLSGPGVFSVQARSTIKREALRLSLLSTVLIVALLLVVYRSVAVLLFGLLPVVSGALAGVAAVALGFGVVHGLTLGFGITLIAESIDYPVYLFVQSRGAQSHGVLWPTIALGALTSIIGFASLLPSAFPGLQQLGLYSITGLVVAAAVTRWILPPLLPRRLAIIDLAPLGRRIVAVLRRAHLPLPAALALAALCALVLYAHRGRLWTHDLAALSPVPAAALRLDAQLRGGLGAPDVSNLVMISAGNEQAALQWAEAAGRRLDALVSAHAIGGYDSPARYLPSQATQAMRLASLPESAPLRARLAAAIAGLPVAPGAFEPFVQQVAAARSAGPITRASLQGTSLALALDALLWSQGTQWRALLPLHAAAGGGDIDTARVRAALATLPADHVAVLNVRQQSDALYSGYLNAALRLSLLGLAAIVLLLALTLRSLRRVVRVIAPLLLAVLVVAAALALAGVALTILHLVGMLLSVAVGSNYALFFDRSAAARDEAGLPRTLASLLVANASTVLGFSVLAFSSVPVLSALGMTVAPGTLLALLLAALLAPRSLFEAGGPPGTAARRAAPVRRAAPAGSSA
jgi:predicted exporter